MRVNLVNNRWWRAQKAELKARKIKPPWELTDRRRSQSLEHMRKYTSLSEEHLKNMRILEIGGTVIETTFDHVNIPPKLVLDPLFPFARVLGQQDKSCHRVKGMGEYLPLPDKNIDLCWCANTIDHTFSPSLVLREIRRVLDDDGMLIISCNLFPTWAKLLFPIFNTLDAPHPHHFTITEFKTLLKQQFDIQREFEVRSFSRLLLTQGLKNNMAAVFGVKYIYFRCTPRQ